jgi:hypothetical protein
MKRSPRARITVSLSDSVQQYLNMYALAASAAGVGMLALATTAQAKIVYTPTHRIIDKSDIYRLDLNHDGITDFSFVNYYGCNFDYCFDTLGVSPVRKENGAAGTATFIGFQCAYALRVGAVIGPKLPFAGKIMAVGSTVPGSQWRNVTNRYLGLKFAIKGAIHYGWARLTVKINGIYVNAVLAGYAYETIPNKSIIAGRTKGPDDDDQPVPATLKTHTPEPATLGMLALGAPGLSIWRREESVAATPEHN